MPKKFDLSLIPPAPNLEFETPLWQQGLWHVAGVDEAGRGALAGPVCAAAVILPPDVEKCKMFNGVRDSKQLNAKKREEYFDLIVDNALASGVAFVSNKEIDLLGIAPATRFAATRALMGMGVLLDHILIDYIPLPKVATPQTSLTKGDQRSLSIACASILAKVTRDKEMVLLDQKFPDYGLADNKGYGTQAHRDAIKKMGHSSAHRKSFNS